MSAGGSTVGSYPFSHLLLSVGLFLSPPGKSAIDCDLLTSISYNSAS